MDQVTYGFIDESRGIPTPNGYVSMPDLLAQDAAICERYGDLRIHAVANARFNGDLKAAADYLGPGAIHVPRFEDQILDLVRGRGFLGQRIQAVPATGHPSRYFEQRAIVDGGFVDPRVITPAPGTPQRSPRALMIKAISGGTNFGLFDVETSRQEGKSSLVSKDVMDMIKGMLRTSDKALWRGTDTSLEIPTTNQYVGGLLQINRTFSVASGASIVSAIQAEVAAMMANEAFEVRPTAIYAQTQAHQLIDDEEKANHRTMPQMDVTNRDNTVIAGVKVSAITTAAGLLPILPDWSLPAPVISVTEANKKDYTIVILTEPLVEYHYVTTPEPRVFVTGLLANLATQYIGVLFGAVVFKGKADAVNTPEVTPLSYPHSVGTITR